MRLTLEAALAMARSEAREGRFSAAYICRQGAGDRGLAASERAIWSRAEEALRPSRVYGDGSNRKSEWRQPR
jgi:hypothetical protein